MKKNSVYSGLMVSDIKKVVFDKWDEIERNTIPRDVLYQRMVDEAVILIQALWKDDAKYKAEKIKGEDVFEVEAYSAFMISPDLKLYSEKSVFARNPNTGKCCFFDVYKFDNGEEVDKFVNDVLERLPEGTVCSFTNDENHIDKVYVKYIFKLKINMK